jgi:hypothetical protein
MISNIFSNKNNNDRNGIEIDNIEYNIFQKIKSFFAYSLSMQGNKKQPLISSTTQVAISLIE